MGLYGLWEGYFVGGERKKGVCESIGYIEGKCPEGFVAGSCPSSVTGLGASVSHWKRTGSRIPYLC